MLVINGTLEPFTGRKYMYCSSCHHGAFEEIYCDISKLFFQMGSNLLQILVQNQNELVLQGLRSNSPTIDLTFLVVAKDFHVLLSVCLLLHIETAIW